MPLAVGYLDGDDKWGILDVRGFGRLVSVCLKLVIEDTFGSFGLYYPSEHILWLLICNQKLRGRNERGTR
jgi:hypothetical protein